MRMVFLSYLVLGVVVIIPGFYVLADFYNVYSSLVLWYPPSMTSESTGPIITEAKADEYRVDDLCPLGGGRKHMLVWTRNAEHYVHSRR